MGTNTDPYQHAEGKYHLTRGIVETLSMAPEPVQHPDQVDARPPRRHAALLAATSQRTDVSVSFSIGTLDRSVWSLTEPGTSPPDRRVEALRRLTALGISCGVLVAPVLPGLSDSEAQLNEVVEACAEAGAVSISGVALHLRGPLGAHYFDWLEGVRPDLVRLHRQRFGRGAYQREPGRGRVQEIVRAAARRCGVTGRDRYSGSTGTSARTARRGPRAAPPSLSRAAPGAAPDAPYDRGLMPGTGEVGRGGRGRRAAHGPGGAPRRLRSSWRRCRTAPGLRGTCPPVRRPRAARPTPRTPSWTRRAGS